MRIKITFVDGCWYADGHLLELAYNADGKVTYYVSKHHMIVYTADELFMWCLEQVRRQEAGCCLLSLLSGEV